MKKNRHISILALVIGIIFFSCKATEESKAQQSDIVPMAPVNPCADKICIDTLNTNYLVGKWYDFSPNFFVEQPNYVAYYLNKPAHLTDSTNYIGTFEFNKDFTFEQTFKINDTSFKSREGTWNVDPHTRRLILSISDSKYKPTLTIIELNRDIFILKHGY